MKTKQEKQKEADVRNSAYRALSPQQKLQRMDARLGKNKGGKRERDRLQYEIDAQL